MIKASFIIKKSIHFLRGRLFSKSDQASVSFRCNICGRSGKVLPEQMTREEQTCKCGSTIRQRSIIYLLSRELFGGELMIGQFPERKDIVGLDMSGAENYACQLPKKLSYTNTYLHKPPLLDIRTPLDMWLEHCDFVISSDVFEHVPPPVSLAFSNTFKLLKPGGLLILTVPYSTDDETLEHFPELHQYELMRERNRFSLENVTRQGAYQKFDNLIFHGGEGETLEMRVFSENGLIQALSDAGFVDIRMHPEPYAPFGIVWLNPWSLPITARKPV